MVYHLISFHHMSPFGVFQSVCVCVWNIWTDVKLLLWSFFHVNCCCSILFNLVGFHVHLHVLGFIDFTLFSEDSAGGRGMQSGTTSNEATWLYGIQSLISSAYLLPISVHGNRLSQEPASRFQFFGFLYTVVAIWTHVCWTSFSVRTEIQPSSFRYLTVWHLFLRTGIWSLRGTRAFAAWVLSISC